MIRGVSGWGLAARRMSMGGLGLSVLASCLAAEPRSPELRLLRHHPEPWTPADTAAWALIMAWGLSASWESKLLYKSSGEEGWNDARH